MNKFVPCVSRLECRATPASLTVSGNTLSYQGDSGNHTLVLTDDGAGDLVGKLDNNAPVVASGITNIQVISLNGGSDKIKDTLTKARTASESLTVELGKASCFNGNFQPGTQSGFFSFAEIRSGNTGKTTINLGGVQASGGEVATIVNMNSSGSVSLTRNGNVAGFAVDVLDSVQSTTSDSLTFAGIVTGTYGAMSYGTSGSGSATIKLNIGSGSTGMVFADVFGSTNGGDKDTLDITDNSGGTDKLYASIYTTQQNINSGNVSSTSNVSVLTY